MLKYIKYKIFSHKLKMALYDAFQNADAWVVFLNSFATACKDKSTEEIYKDLVSSIAEKVHEDTHKED